MYYFKRLFISIISIFSFLLPLAAEENHAAATSVEIYTIEKAKHEAYLQHEFLINSQKRILKTDVFEQDKIKVDVLNTHYFDNVIVFSRKTLTALKPSDVNSTVKIKAIFNRDRLIGLYCYTFYSDNSTGPDYACIYSKKGKYLGIAQVKSTDINYFRFLTTQKPSARTQAYIQLAKKLYLSWQNKRKKMVMASSCSY